MALLALEIKKGDEVIVPAFTFPATANVVELVGAKSVFVDINLSDFCIDTSKIEKVITNKTKALIPVHEFGQPSKMDAIVNIAKRYHLKIVEDAACALGAEFENQKVGTLGEFGCFSFHPRKAITTGEGGLVITNDNELAQKVRVLRNHGISYKDGKVDFIAAGLNYRMTDFQAVLGISQLEDIDKIIIQRIETASKYNNRLKKANWIKTPHVYENRKMVYQTYHVVLDDKDRDELVNYLKAHKIETNLGAQALHCLTYYKNKYTLNESDFPNAVKAYRKGLALPIGKQLNQKDFDKVVQILIEYKSCK